MDKKNSIELRKFVAPEFVFGSGALDLVGGYVRNLSAKNVLVVSDAGVHAAGWTGKVIDSLSKDNIATILFGSIQPNPRSAQVMEGAALFTLHNCDAIVAVGGGSVIDCAKGIGIVATNSADITEFEGVDRISVPIPPLICIPTTAGTAADVSQFAIITNEIKKVKFAIISKAVIPDLSLMDPIVLTTMDSALSAYTGLDALVHAFEAYVSNASWALTDIHAEEAVQLLAENLKKSITEPDNLIYRSATMRASLQAGFAFSNASLGAVHALAHSLGGLLDLPHGECNAILLPHVVAYNFSAAANKYERLLMKMDKSYEQKVGQSCEGRLLQTLKQFISEMGVTDTLADLGVTEEEFPQLAKNALADPCMLTNPVQPTEEDMQQILRSALHG